MCVKKAHILVEYSTRATAVHAEVAVVDWRSRAHDAHLIVHENARQ